MNVTIKIRNKNYKLIKYIFYILSYFKLINNVYYNLLVILLMI